MENIAKVVSPLSRLNKNMIAFESDGSPRLWAAG